LGLIGSTTIMTVMASHLSTEPHARGMPNRRDYEITPLWPKTGHLMSSIRQTHPITGKMIAILQWFIV
jgi:hypothetical protein